MPSLLALVFLCLFWVLPCGFVLFFCYFLVLFFEIAVFSLGFAYFFTIFLLLFSVVL